MGDGASQKAPEYCALEEAQQAAPHELGAPAAQPSAEDQSNDLAWIASERARRGLPLTKAVLRPHESYQSVDTEGDQHLNLCFACQCALHTEYKHSTEQGGVQARQANIPPTALRPLTNPGLSADR